MSEFLDNVDDGFSDGEVLLKTEMSRGNDEIFEGKVTDVFFEDFFKYFVNNIKEEEDGEIIF